MPMDSEKNACPSATSTVRGVTAEKSGLKKKRSPSPPPGMRSEWTERTTRIASSSGMSTLAERSIPFSTPRAMMTWVSSTKSVV